MALIKLKCPSCAATLDLPGNLTVAHCMYCGTKILLDPENGLRDQKAVKNFVELCDALLDAKNYVEAAQFATKALERDPKNADAWVVKALATFWQSTPESDRYDEAISYLSKAGSLAPNADRLVAASNELGQARAEWHKRLGEETFRLAQERYKISLASPTAATKLVPKTIGNSNLLNRLSGPGQISAKNDHLGSRTECQSRAPGNGNAPFFRCG